MSTKLFCYMNAWHFRNSFVKMHDILQMTSAGFQMRDKV